MRNEIKLKFDVPKYFVNEKEGVVVCVLDYCVLYPTHILDLFYWQEDNCPRICTCKATAKVRENETFDINVGKKVALAKAEQKAYNHVFKYCIKALKCCAKIMDTLDDFHEKAIRVIDHNEEYISKF